LSARKIIILNIILLFSVFLNNSNSQTYNYPNQLRLAKTFETRGQLEEAEKIYADLYYKQPQNYQFYSSLFKIFSRQKKYDKALSLVKNQIEISKSKVSLYGDLGSVYFLLGKEKEATRVWDEALDFEPKNAFAYRTIANSLIENRLLERAIEVLKKGNAVSEDKTIFSYDIANFYSITMKYEEATKEYCKILDQKPKQLNLIKNKILGFINSNQATEPTLKTVREIYENEENIIYLRLLAKLYSRTNNDFKALDAIIDIEEQTTKNGSAIFTFAQQSDRDGNHKIASLAYKNIVDHYPSSALFPEAEIGYTRSLESDLNNKSRINLDWKPLSFNESISVGEYKNLLKAYQNLVIKYPQNKIGWEAEYRISRIYLDNLKDLSKADSIFNKILAEMKSLQYIKEAKFGIAQILIKNDDLIKSEMYLRQVSDSRSVSSELKIRADFLLAKIQMWKGKFSESIELFRVINQNLDDDNTNDALQYSLILNTFKNDSTNLFSFINSDYLLERKKYSEALLEFKKLAENDNLFLLKDFAAIRYAELLLALNNYQEAGIFLEEVSNCDEVNIFKDRFLYLLGSNYYYGLKDYDKARESLTKLFEEFQNSIYYSKAIKIISEINERVGNTL